MNKKKGFFKNKFIIIKVYIDSGTPLLIYLTIFFFKKKKKKKKIFF